jgi:hypothetical protein
MIILSALNPIDLGRILFLMKFDIAALMGYTGAVFQRFFGSGLGGDNLLSVCSGLSSHSFCHRF